MNLDQSDLVPDAKDSGWWNHCIGDIPLPTPCTVTPDMPCSDVIQLLREEGFDQLPVVDDGGEIHGVVTESNLLYKIRSLDKDFNSVQVRDVLFKKFKTVALSTKLWELSRILDRHPFVLVTASQRVFTGKDKGSKQRTMVLSVLTRIDLINHIVSQMPEAQNVTLSRSASLKDLKELST